ncbi:MAG: DUF4832 domain-containing protein [Clostridia bacterium]|nr:DUF4832 domain-containing protein [Clostridia bacterium]
MKVLSLRRAGCLLTAALLTLTACGGGTGSLSSAADGSSRAVSRAASLSSAVSGSEATSSAVVVSGEAPWTTVTPAASEEAFANPMKGFRAQWYQVKNGTDNPYFTTIREYIGWNAIEKNASATAQDIIEVFNARFEGLADKNVRVIPRVYLEWPSSDRQHNQRFWPIDMEEGDYKSDEFFARVVNLVRKMAEAWDNDPRIAGIEMGIYGYWGEHHLSGNTEGYPSSITEKAQKVLGDAFSTYFKNKKVMVRYPGTFTDYDFGFYFDSFALGSAMPGEAAALEKYRPDAWKTQMISGEVAYDWGDYKTTVGDDPTDSLSDPVHRQHIIDWIRKVHCSSLGWIASYNDGIPAAIEGAAEMQKVFGYLYIIESFSYTARAVGDGAFSCEVTLRNDGSAPFYYDWPLTLELLDPDTLKPVYTKAFNFDIRTLLPGDDYDDKAHAYATAPETKTATLSVTLPASLKGKGYLVSLSIYDPSCNKPAIRFACASYLNGGHHPMGTVDYGGTASMPARFDSLQLDKTLHYAN